MYAAPAHAPSADMHTIAMMACVEKAAPVEISMPMITVHWVHGAWMECHHGALRKRLPVQCQVTGFSERLYADNLTPAQVLIAVRDNNPGCDVQLITTALRRNEYALWERRAAQ